MLRYNPNTMPRWLKAFGLAGAGELRGAVADVESAKAKAAEFKRQLEETRDETRKARARADDLADRLERATREAERWKGKDGEHVEELNALRAKMERLRAAEQNLTLAREHLVSVETKLDIVEGAIDALDRRTRAVLAARDRSGGSGA